MNFGKIGSSKLTLPATGQNHRQETERRNAKENTMEDEPTDPNLRPLEIPEPKQTPLGKIPSKSEKEMERPQPSMPPIGKSEEFVKGYKAGYQDGKSRKQPKF
jgi:hypothetical protein